ncbi:MULTISPECIES: complex I subunit 4 family protein [Aneurinibacillus]|uniref:NADH-quinone oxidoreductase subunit M n=1 Tax=Aneurinibacillus thermoaerophilus TaxID=143495 RepID=A0A1G8A0D3_ANETH|nr:MULTISPECIES: NADH-quinone oxidoreductase subunit M [Aneurinibacillus]AMA71653.1 NADH:ubiquinone oxidoreductase subunit M [Aneurinibacillus sp. XH2]MED0676101.1 NADH-quinone oxidoreductase subunit M [Aneurinibacillus thermoaerophilus]MED0680799.1 NADH-quinone oxidoreductase subunit M [Aneurinibacillus thermoaerophilus]MED0738366.1 NADH-quinone oxidoreductase subunit M [Aneurinibacillus thermoaerophilus]MED0757638.1 NADH-quinone oxidoreductase subunit M [Aneurinibacillus thermoaerophilus]
MANYFLIILTFSPLLGVLLLAFIPKSLPGTVKAIGILATLVPLVLTFMLYANFNLVAEGMQLSQQWNWIRIPIGEQAIPITFEVGVDGLSMPLLVLTTVISTMAAVAALSINKRWKEFYILFLIVEMGMLGVFSSTNLFQFFIFFEFTIIPLFFMMGIWGYMDRERAAMKFLLYNGVGSAIMLIVFVTLFILVGTLSMEEIRQLLTDPMSPRNVPNLPGYIPDSIRFGLFLALLIAFAIKIPVVPFHTWMLKAYQEAHPAVIMISSGVLIKIGGYALIRMNAAFFPEWMNQLSTLIAVLGVINILYGAVLALVQDELKQMLAYSSVSHMGIMLLGLAATNLQGFQGAVFQMVSHGLIAALMFYMVSLVHERTGTSNIRELGGLAKSMPMISGVLLTAMMASAGLPGMSGFISEFLSFVGLFGVKPVIAAVGALGLILTAAYLLRAILGTTFGPIQQKHESLSDAQAIEVVPMVVLLSLVILIGVYPAVLSEPLQTTLQNIVPRIGG